MLLQQGVIGKMQVLTRYNATAAAVAVAGSWQL
jgi:hypothetical protein